MKKRIWIVFALLVIGMSSCVYSLFPIYTDDTLVSLPGLVGVWKGDDDSQYIVFQPAGSRDADLDYEPRDYIVINGDTIRNEELTEAYFQKELNAAFQRLGRAIGSVDRNKKSYKMSIYDDHEVDQTFTVHLVRIGEDIFMDLYPEEIRIDHIVAENFFPVHTFMKIDLINDRLDMIMFDLEKLSRLFESNLVRMRHENVEGSILITAQPKEIQKFLDKYSDDETVFEEVTTYTKVG